MHGPGLSRGPVPWGIKQDGYPDYHKTSTDELLLNGQLAKSFILIDDLSIEGIQTYVSQGMPISYHLGYVNLNDRVERAKWWKGFWENATNGDKNSHSTDIKDLLIKETKKHNLPLWLE